MSDDHIMVCEYSRIGTNSEWRPICRDRKIQEIADRAQKAEQENAELKAEIAEEKASAKHWESIAGINGRELETVHEELEAEKARW